MKSHDTNSGDLAWVATSELLGSPMRLVGTDEGALGDLSSAGYDEHNPILAYADSENRLRVIDGERRLLLARKEDVDEVAVRVMNVDSPERARELILRSGMAVAGRNQFELAVQLKDFGEDRPDLRSSRQIGEHLGCSHAQAQRLRRLNGLPPAVFQHGLAGKLRASEALLLLRLEDDQEQLDLADRLAKGTITSLQFRDLVARALGPSATSKRNSDSKSASTKRWPTLRATVLDIAKAAPDSERQTMLNDLRQLVADIEALSVGAGGLNV